MKKRVLATLLLLCILTGMGSVAFTETLSATVNTKNDPLNLWNAPDGSTCLVRIPKGESITILEKDDKWSKAEYDGKTGYVRTEFLLFLDEDEFAVKLSDAIEALYEERSTEKTREQVKQIDKQISALEAMRNLEGAKWQTSDGLLSDEAKRLLKAFDVINNMTFLDKEGKAYADMVGFLDAHPDVIPQVQELYEKAIEEVRFEDFDHAIEVILQIFVSWKR